MAPSVGIDLGTCYSRIGVFRNDCFEIIPNEEGYLTTPSFVAFTDTGRLIGYPAKNQLAMNPRNTVFNAQRLIGRRFADFEVQAGVKHYPFAVIDRNGKPAIQVEFKGEIMVFTPEEIISMILAKLKQVASKYLGVTVNNAVITCPTYFNDSQRQSIKDAALIADFNTLRVIDAPTTASIAYEFNHGVEGERNIVFVDVGGGTVNVSLLIIEEGLFEVKSVAGDTHLGGENFDDYLVNEFVNQFKVRHGMDLTQNRRALCRLRTACESAKRALSSSTRAPIEIDSLFNGIDFRTSITRERFEEICQALFHNITMPIERVLADAKVDKSDIHDIVLIGGSSRIPKIQKILSHFFNGKALNKSVNTDEAACHGAAIQAAVLGGDRSSKYTNQIMLLDVAALSIGIETFPSQHSDDILTGIGSSRMDSTGGSMTPLLNRNTSIPTKKTETFSTAYDNQAVITIKVYEGERRLVRDNNLLGSFELQNIPPLPRGVPRVEVTLEIDANRNMHVSALEKSTGKKNMTVITNDKNRLSRDEIKRMVAEAKRFKRDDEAEEDRLSARNNLEAAAYGFKDVLSSKISNGFSDGGDIKARIDKIITWIDENEFATITEYKSQTDELETIGLEIYFPRV